MNSFKFSPIKNEAELNEAVRYIHFACHKLCKKVFGKYLPVAGNIGLFCHYDDEYKLLTKIREKLTQESDNWNEKYYRLHKPLVLQGSRDIPETIYTYLYIRRPDQKIQVGDVDFVLNEKEYDKLKNSLSNGKKIRGMEIMDRPDLDLIKLFDQNIDVLSFIGKRNMEENVGI
jgi:hypothetical protein